MARTVRADSAWQFGRHRHGSRSEPAGVCYKLQVRDYCSENSVRNPLAIDDLPIYTWRPSSNCDNSGPGIGDGCRNLAKVRLFFP